MSSNLSLKSIMEANKLVGPNFLDWFCNLRIFLKQEKKLYVLDTTIPPKLDVNANDEVCERYQRHINDVEQVTYAMLASMSPELKRQYENMSAPTIILHLKELFGAQIRMEIYETSKALYQCKMTEGSSVELHILKMIGYIEKLSQLGIAMKHELNIDLVLQSLTPRFSQFIINYYTMNQKDVSLLELLNMLKTIERRLQRYETFKALCECKMAEGSSVELHVRMMIGYIEKLGQLGYVMDHQLNVDLVLQSLTPNFSQFIMNYNMNQRDVTLLEVLNMLKTTEECLKKEANSILIVNSSGSKKKCYKKNKKQKTFVTKVKSIGGVKKQNNNKGTCFHHGINRHQKRNCKVYLTNLKGVNKE